MKPSLLEFSPNAMRSFYDRKDILANINSHWHYHSSLELIYFRKGRGIQVVGDSISKFKDGDILLIGENLPHYWRFEDCYLEKRILEQPEIYVVHFKSDFWGNAFLDLPENQELRKLFSRAKHGIQIFGQEKDMLASIFPLLVNADGLQKIIHLLQALHLFCKATASTLLASVGFNTDNLDYQTEKGRMQRIYDYTITHHREKIDLDKIAAIAGLSRNSFCRFFKDKSQRTYIQYLNEVRISYACKLLTERTLSVKEVCYECGFHNFSSFHTFFRKIMGKSPLEFQKAFVTA